MQRISANDYRNRFGTCIQRAKIPIPYVLSPIVMGSFRRLQHEAAHDN